MTFAFGRDRRLRKHEEFVRAQRLARRVGTDHFTYLVAPQPMISPARVPPQAARSPICPGPAAPRLGIVVSRKIGGAVTRNYVKRLCRECFRTSGEWLPAGVDVIVIARPGAGDLSLEDIRREWLGVSRMLRARAAQVLARARAPHHLGG